MRTATALFAIAFLCISIVSVPLRSQTTGQKPSFEVVSLKPNTTGAPFMRGINVRGDRLDGTWITLRLMLQWAFRPKDTVLMNSQMIGVPGWADTDRYDMQAKLGADVGSIGQEQVQLMMQSLLEDRFQLRARQETRELPIYELTIAGKEPKIKLSADQTPPSPTMPNTPTGPSQPPALGSFRLTGKGSTGGAVMLTMSGSAVPLARLTSMLQSYAGRVIKDKTNLSGLFDFTLEFAVDGGAPSASAAAASPAPLASDPSGPTLFDALQEQLGLKLVSAKGPVEVLVIDSVQKPIGN